MTSPYHLMASLFAGLGLLVAGCSWTNSGQLERCQTDKKQLLARVVEEQKRSESLTTELRTSNQRLADAEKQLARVYDGSRGRFTASGGSGASGIFADKSSTGTASVAGGASRSFATGPEPIGGGSPLGNGPGLMASGSGAGRSMQLGAPRELRPGALSNTPSHANNDSNAAAAGPSLDPGGYDLLGPRNGRSESGWMPKSSGRP